MSLGYLVLPANINELIPSLFSNNTKFISSRVELSDVQKSSIVYPEGMNPLNFFVVYQGSNSTELAAFARVRDYVYGIYYTVENVRFDDNELICSKYPVILPNNAKLVKQNYLEVYLDVEGLIMLNGFDSTKLQSWVQYTNDGFFHGAIIDTNGIINEGKAFRVTGLSENLKICKCEVELGCGKKPSLVPKSASLKDTLAGLFINWKRVSTNPQVGLQISTSVVALLSDSQKLSINYPEGFTPLNYFVLSQVLTENASFDSFTITAFATKDNHLYGLYYYVTNQKFYDSEFLANTNKPITLDPNAILTSYNYFEFYFCVDRKVILNGLSYADPISGSLQYSTKKRFFHNWLYPTGIPSEYYFRNPEFNTGLSRTLDLSCE